MSRKKLPVVLNEEERKALLKRPNSRYVTGQRNYTMLRLMLNTGLRLAEIIDLKWDDMDFLTETLMVRNGKGGKDRQTFIKDNNFRGEDDITLLQGWKKRQKEKAEGLLEYVFTSMSKGTIGNQINRRYVQDMVKRYGERAGIKKSISPHTLRHTFATDFYRHTKDIVLTKKALGHADISTTMIYTHLVDDDLEGALSGKFFRAG